MLHLMSQLPRLRVAALVASIAAAAVAAPVQAADSVNIAVSAQIVGVCKFFGSGYTMKIGTGGSGTDIDPSETGGASGEVEIEYRCSNGTTPTFSVPTSLNLTGAGTMQATFTSSNSGGGTGMGNGQGQTLTINGAIAESEYADKLVGSYSGTLTVSVNP